MRKLNWFIVILACSMVSGDWLQEYYKRKKSQISSSVITTAVEPTKEPLKNNLPYQQVGYTVANISENYKSSVEFHPRGMARLYKMTNKLLRFIEKEQAFPQAFLEVTTDQQQQEPRRTVTVNDVIQEWPMLVKHYGTALLIWCTILAFSVLMPTAGITFCCLRCVGKCGATSHPYDRRYDPCRRYFFAFILSGVLILILFGLVCLYSTNEVVENGVKTLPGTVRAAIDDSELYLNNTQMEYHTLLVANFKEMETSLSIMLSMSGKELMEKLGIVSKASVLSNLTVIMEGLSVIKTDLNKVDSLTKLLQDNSVQLDQGLSEIKEKIIVDLNECVNETPCRDLFNKYDFTNFALQSNFSRLPNVTIDLKNLSRLTAANIEKEVAKSRQEFESVQSDIQETVEKHIPLMKMNIRKTGEALETFSSRVAHTIDRLKYNIRKNAPQAIDSGERIIKKYSPYRYYVGLSVNIVISVIVSVIAIGILCGVFGTRPSPDYEEDDPCGNKGTGAYWLMSAAYIMILVSAFFAYVTGVYFMLGVLADKIVCETMRNPYDNRLLNLADQVSGINTFYRPNEVYGTMHMGGIIQSCMANMSLYEVMRMDRIYNVSELLDYTEKFGLKEYIKEIIDSIKFEFSVNILTPSAKKLLVELAHSSLNDINFSLYPTVLKEKITSIDLVQLISDINRTASQLSPEYDHIRNDLHNRVLYLQIHQDLHINKMSNLAKELVNTTRDLQEHLKFNHTSLQEAVEHFLSDVDEAQIFLKNEGNVIVSKLAKEYGMRFINYMDEYLNKVVTQTRDEIGNCWPVAKAYNATVVNVCDKIITPFNGFWFSLCCVLALFVPATILCVCLADLYKITDPYPGPLVNAEYLCDLHVGDPDSIPLSGISRDTIFNIDSRHATRVYNGNGDLIKNGFSSGGHAHGKEILRKKLLSHRRFGDANMRIDRQQGASDDDMLNQSHLLRNGPVLNAGLRHSNGSDRNIMLPTPPNAATIIGSSSSSSSNRNSISDIDQSNISATGHLANAKLMRFDGIVPKQRWPEYPQNGIMHQNVQGKASKQMSEYERPPPYYNEAGPADPAPRT